MSNYGGLVPDFLDDEGSRCQFRLILVKPSTRTGVLLIFFGSAVFRSGNELGNLRHLVLATVYGTHDFLRLLVTWFRLHLHYIPAFDSVKRNPENYSFSRRT